MVSKSCEDWLTFYTITEDKKIISKSAVHPYQSEENPNLQQVEQKETVHALGEILQIPEFQK